MLRPTAKLALDTKNYTLPAKVGFAYTGRSEEKRVFSGIQPFELRQFSNDALIQSRLPICNESRRD